MKFGDFLIRLRSDQVDENTAERMHEEGVVTTKGFEHFRKIEKARKASRKQSDEEA